MKSIKLSLVKGLTKAPTGIKGFDDITHGGLPSGRTTLLMGEPGFGKTLFALRLLVHGAQHCTEPGIFVAFEEQSERIVANAAAFGWNLPELQRKNLYFLNAQPSPDIIQSGSFDLSGLPANSGAAVSTPRRPSSRCGRSRCIQSLRRSRQRKRCWPTPQRVANGRHREARSGFGSCAAAILQLGKERGAANK